MTIHEARKQIDDAERKINESYSDMKSTARNVGRVAVNETQNNTNSKTIGPLVISVVGLILALLGHPVWGVLLIVGGIFIAYTLHSSASEDQSKVATLQQRLNSELDRYNKL